MKFSYKKECSLKVGQKLYGIIGVSIFTHDGVYPIVVDRIDYNDEEIIFKIDQPCGYVSCLFHEVEMFVFESKEEAEDRLYHIPIGNGMYEY